MKTLPGLLWIAAGSADPALGVTLDGAAAVKLQDCTIVTLRFNAPVTLRRPEPEQRGTKVQILVATAGDAPAHPRTRIAAPPNASLIRSIEFAGAAGAGGLLDIAFTHSTGYAVRPGDHSNSIELVLADVGASACGVRRAGSELAEIPRANAMPGELETEAEAALIAGAADRALTLMRRSVALPESSFTPRALELQGLAQARLGDQPSARQSFELYLRRYPAGDGAHRVAQRLADLTTGPRPMAQSSNARPRSKSPWKTDVIGIASQFFYRDRSRSTFADPRRAGLGGEIDERDNIDQLLSAVDVTLTAADSHVRLEARVSTLITSDFRKVSLVGAVRGGGGTERLQAAYVDVRDSADTLSLRLGRQQLLGAGVFGRFDGAGVGLQASPRLRLHAIGGFPVLTTRNTAVDTGRFFYGVSADYAWPGDRLTTSAYWIDQRVSGLVDRQALGAELRLTARGLTVYAVGDFDVHFGKLSQALLSANYAIGPRTTVTVALDNLHYPVLSTSDAVIGQPVPDLDVVRRQYDRAALRQLARDRALAMRSASLTVSRVLSSHWQIDADVAVVGTDSPPESGGVAAIPAGGHEVYAGAQLVGTDLLGMHDAYTAGFRVADLARFRLVSGDVSAHLPLGSKLRLDPQLRYADRSDKYGGGGLRRLQLSSRLVYRVTGAAEIEIEGGGTRIWQNFDDPVLTGPRLESSWLLNAGYRISF